MNQPLANARSDWLISLDSNGREVASRYASREPHADSRHFPFDHIYVEGTKKLSKREWHKNFHQKGWKQAVRLTGPVYESYTSKFQLTGFLSAFGLHLVQELSRSSLST